MNYLTKMFSSRLLHVFFTVGLFVPLMTCEHVGGVVEVESADARIIPGKSVDGVNLGDSRETVEAKLGKPTSIGWLDGLYRSWRHYTYNDGPHAGLTIAFIDYGASYGPVDMLSIEKSYTGKTKEGIGIGSSPNMVHQTYGTPRKIISNLEDGWIVDFYCSANKKLEVHYYKDSLVTGMSIGYFLPTPQDTTNPCE